jgi:hypothetical protein
MWSMLRRRRSGSLGETLSCDVIVKTAEEAVSPRRFAYPEDVTTAGELAGGSTGAVTAGGPASNSSVNDR